MKDCITKNNSKVCNGMPKYNIMRVYFVGYDVLRAVVMNDANFRNTTSCSPMWTDVSEKCVISIRKVENQSMIFYPED
jgi:hypothetical protein